MRSPRPSAPVVWRILLPAALLLAHLAQGAADYEVTFVDGHLVCTDISGNGDVLTLLEKAGEAGSVRLYAGGRTFSVNGGPNTTTETAPFLMADLNSVTIDAGAGHDAVWIQTNIAGNILNLPGMTIHGGTGNDQVWFRNDVTFEPGAGLNVDLQDDDATPGEDQITVYSDASLLLSGEGGVIFKASRSIAFGGNAALETVDGSILAEANQQAVATAGIFHGVSLSGAARVQATGTGSVTLRGRSGNAGGIYGINVTGGAKVLAASGGITLAGQGQTGHADGNNYGAHFHGTGTQVKATGGSVHLTGAGGGSTGSGGSGIVVADNAEISATGAGDVMLIGQGGNLESSFSGSNVGVVFNINTPVVTTEAGNLTIIGTAGGGAGSSSNVAVWQNSGTVGTGGGNLTINGSGSAAGQGDGVNIHRASQTNGGNIQITGTGGAQGGTGIILTSGNNLASGGGDITLHGTSGGGVVGSGRGVFQSGSLLAAGGDISVTGAGAGANTLVDGLYSLAPITTSGMGTITLHGTASPAGGGHGVDLTSSSEVSTAGGGISITGIGGGGVFGTASYGVNVTRPLSGPGAGEALTIHGTGGAGAVSNAIGVFISGSNAQVQTSGGDINITGIGGAAAASFGNGIYVISSSLVRAGGNGSLTLHGTGGGGTNGHGVAVFGQLLTSGGDLVVTGAGGANSALAFGLVLAGPVSAGGTGGIALTGTGGAAEGNSQHGVGLSDGISTNNGPVTITGTAGGQNATLGGRGISKSSSASITVGGDHVLTLVADSMALAGNNKINVAGNKAFLLQKTAGTGIALGAEDTVTGDPLVLGLTDSELDTIVADEMQVGNADTGAMSVAGAISPLSYPALRLAQPVTFSDGGSFHADITSESVFERLIVNGGVTLEAGSGIGGTVLGGFLPAAAAVIPVIQGNDGVAGSFTGRPEGASVGLGGLSRQMRLTYAAGGGDHIAFYGAPVVVVLGNDVIIPRGASTPSTSDHTDFGATKTYRSRTTVRSFTVLNDGLAPLSGISAAVSAGTPAGVFSLTGSPAAALASGESGGFDVTFDPEADGLQSATVTVTSDQVLDSPYTFAIQGTGEVYTAQEQFEDAMTEANLIGPDALATATPGGDGVANLLKFAFNLDLTAPDVRSLATGSGIAGLPVITFPSPGVMRVEYLRRIDSGLIYSPQKSSLLGSGSWTGLVAPPVPTPIDTDWERVCHDEPFDPNTTVLMFGRVKVTIP